MGKVYAIFAFIGGLLLAVFKIFSVGKQSAQNEIKAEAEETAREYQNAGSEAIIGGLKREEKVKHEDIDTVSRSDFE